jgi:hypothetical protein
LDWPETYDVSSKVKDPWHVQTAASLETTDKLTLRRQGSGIGETTLTVVKHDDFLSQTSQKLERQYNDGGLVSDIRWNSTHPASSDISV